MKYIIDDYRNIDNLKKNWKNEIRVVTASLFNFHEIKKKKKDILLALNFTNVPKREIPEIVLLHDLNFIFVDNLKQALYFLKKKKKIVYIFKDVEQDLKYMFENFSKTEKSLFLRNTYFEIRVEKFSKDLIYKKVVSLKKEFSKFISTEKAKKINILLKNSFSKIENEELLSDKLLKISGIIYEEKNEE